MEPKLISQTPVSMSELKSEIASIKKREKEPSMRVTKMEDYLNSINILPEAKEKELIEAIRKLDIPRMRDELVFKIAEMLPKSVDELKVVLQGYVISVTSENIKRIADAVNPFAGKPSEKKPAEKKAAHARSRKP